MSCTEYVRSRLSALDESMDVMLDDMRFDVFQPLKWRFCELACTNSADYSFNDLFLRMRDLCSCIENAELNGEFAKVTEYSARLAELSRLWVNCFAGGCNG